jgi:hypothetical protein
MRVYVDEPGHGEGATEIYDLGVLTGHRLDLGIRADDQELAVLTV